MKSKLLPYYGYSAAMLFIILCCTPTILFANQNTSNFKDNVDQQKIMVTGKITDHSGALPGVVVQIVSTNTATLTDHDGNYTIEVTPGNKLSFSYMGYITKTIEIINQHTLNLTLEQDSKELDEIVVNAGYYTVKDRERTGSIARVTSKDIEFQPVTNPLQAIQGRVAGVNITQVSGVPGGGIQVEVRGRNFLDGARGNLRNQPLYIINGIPISSEPFGLNGQQLGQNIFDTGISPLNTINPNDIESIEILKDADATAIYGSRGANGVVLITTKTGQDGPIKFTFSSSIAFSKITNTIKMMSTEDYIRVRKEAFRNNNVTTYPVAHYDINGTWDQERYTNWQKELTGDTALDKNIAFGISGGTLLSNFNINLTHNESTTVFPTDKGYKRDALLFNYRVKSKNNKLSLNTTTNYSKQSNNLPTTDLTVKALTLPPNAPALYTKDGQFNGENKTFINPLRELIRTYENETTTFNINGTLSYNVTPNLQLITNAGISHSQFLELNINPHTATDPAHGYTSEISSSSKELSNRKSYIIEPQIKYNNSWHNNSIDFLFGFTYQFSSSSLFSISGSNFSSDAFIRNIAAAKTKNIFFDLSSEYKYSSVFARINYNHKQKYIANLTMRRDGSSRFAPNNRFGNFGALGVAWILSKEKFMENFPWISFAKLRTSYGFTGSDNIGNYAYLDSYDFINNQYNNNIAIKPSSLYNPNYKWEKTKKFEIALELSLLNNSINSSIAYYNNRSTDQLVGYTLPSTTGFASINKNSVAVVENSGWEFTINTTNIKTNNFKWTSNFNLSIPRNILLSYPGLEEGTQSSIFIIGKSLNIDRSYQYNGIDQETGYYTFTDFNTDGIINTLDKNIITDLNPKFLGGLQNTLNFKNFTLDFLFYFVNKKSPNQDRTYYKNIGNAISNLPTSLLNYWSPENPNGRYMAPSYGNSTISTLASNYAQSNATISDGSYIRLKNISVSYNLNLQKFKLDSAKVFLQAQNLFTLTKYYGADPEFIYSGYLPPLRTISIGIEANF
ncbi:SusC/RagA family TonB-linked outer membrane protein [Myroides sp. LJL110]